LTGLLGPAKRVTAMTGIAIPEREVEGADHKRERIRAEVDDNAQVVIDFGEATFAVVTAGYTMQKYKCPAVELYGTTGTIQMLGNDWAPEGYELWQNEIGAWQYYYETDPSWNWTDGLRHAVECIHNNTRPIVTPEQAYHVLEIMLKAQEAGHDGQTRQIESTFVPAMFETELETEAAHLVHDPRRQK
jgi:predicted dehydrogenase